jgi:hyperosmotically inducible periplasmic protein
MRILMTGLCALALVCAVGCSEADKQAANNQAQQAQNKAKDTANSATKGAKDAANTAKDAGADALITGKVKTKLLAESPANAAKVNVDTKDGVVTLTGTIDSNEFKAKAESLAKATEGVKSVTNNITVQK